MPKVKKSMTAAERRERDGHWAEDPQHPVSDWQYEVANGDTRLGYWEWLAAKLEGGG